MNEEFIKVPKERIGIIIGKEGATKELIEKTLFVALEISGDDSSVLVTDTEDTEDPLAVWKTRDMIKAIARGFSPEKALLLKDDGTIVEVIDISEYTGKSQNSLARLKGRLIGQEGKTRKYIESMTGAYLSIYGKTVSILGTFEDVYDAKKAVELLLSGKPHSGVYKYLDKVYKAKKDKSFAEMAKMSFDNSF